MGLMAEAQLRPFCKECGLLTSYTDVRFARREFGPSWPFEAGEGDVPELESFPLAPVTACACRIGKAVEDRPYPCERFSPGC